VQLTGGGAWDADEVIIATSAAAAATLLAPLAGDAARALAAANAHSSTTVEVAYERDAIAHPLDGSGFVVGPGVNLDGLRACTFTGSKFSARGPSHKAALRLFFRPENEHDELDDEHWIARATAALGHVLKVEANPLQAWVSRWPRALPVFDAAHHARVAELERALVSQHARLAGSAFHGSGLDAAVSSGERAADAVRA
jgi:oxygen-dependent protoporphyrinogen oxidase